MLGIDGWVYFREFTKPSLKVCGDETTVEAGEVQVGGEKMYEDRDMEKKRLVD